MMQFQSILSLQTGTGRKGYLMNERSMLRCGLTFLVVVLVACGIPEEKKAKFFEKGKLLYEQQAYTRSRLEFKNALQIDPKFAEGYFWLGRVEL